MSVTVYFLLFLINQTWARDKYYDYVYHLPLLTSEFHYIMSPNYPKAMHALFPLIRNSSVKYTDSLFRFRWTLEAPTAHVIKIKALTFNLTESQFCNIDSLLVSDDDNPDMFGARKFCGNISALLVESKSNRMRLEFFSSKLNTNPHGKFILQVSAVPTPGYCECGRADANKTYKFDRVIHNGAQEVEVESVVAIIDIGIHRVLCSGTIITLKHVLTLAHCIDGRFPHDVAIVGGKYNLIGEGSYIDTALYRASRFVIHEKYDRITCNNDIGLVVIVNRFLNLQPACLPYKFADVDLTGRNVSAIGYNIAFSNLGTLQSMDLTITDFYPNKRENFMETRGYRDTCAAESGGPIMYIENFDAYVDQPNRPHVLVKSVNFEFVVGISSYRYFGTDKNKGYDIKVMPYLDWIWAHSDRSPHCKF